MPTMQQIRENLSTYCMVDSTDILPSGHLRVETKLLYPDGSNIDVFVEKRNERVPAGTTISDFGQTFFTLYEHQVQPWETRSRLEKLKETVRSLGVELIDDKLSIGVDSLENVQDAVLRLAQACLRASCFIFTRRITQPATFAEEVRQTIEATNLPIKKDKKLQGPYGAMVRVDYRVKGKNRFSSILSMSATRLSHAHNQANEIFRKWSDLRNANVPDQFVTIYDSRSGVSRPDDLERLGTISKVVPITRSHYIQELLLAA